MTVHALFFCLRPDAATAARLSGLIAEQWQCLGLKPQPSREDRLHVTLHHLGWFDDTTESGRAEMARVREAAERAADRCFVDGVTPLRLDFDEVQSFTRKARNRPMVLSGGAGLDAVRALRAALGEALAAQGLPVDPHYVPHLTLGYDDLALPRQPLAVPGWDARAVHLMDSLQGLSRHLPLRQWPPARGLVH